MNRPKIIRITTIPESLSGLLHGQLKYINSFYEVIGIASPGEALKTVEQTEGIRTMAIPMTRKLTPFRDLQGVILLYLFFRKERPLIVHTHTPKAGTLGMFAAYLARVPHRLHTVAGMPLMEAVGAKRYLLDLVEKLTYSCATKVYPNSKGLARFILKEGFTHSNKIKIIGQGSSNGINTTYFDPALFSLEKKDSLLDELGLHQDNYIFLYLGRFVGDKGINELVSAFIEVYKKYPYSRLILGGGYEKELDPVSEETESHISNHPGILNLGWLTDVRPYCAISNVFVFPSYREGFPNVVMQAGAMGLPCLVSDINGSNEIVQNGVNGVIVRVKSIKELQQEMEAYLTGKRKHTEDPIRNRQLIIDRYEQQYIYSELKKEYDALVSTST